MRILHAIPSLDPADGGPPIVVKRLAAAQAATGADVSVLFYERAGAHDRVQRSLHETPGGERLRLEPIPAPSKIERLTARNAKARTRSLLNSGVDFVHIHGIWTPILAAVANAAAEAAVRYCITPHGMLDPWSLSRKRVKKQLALTTVWRRILNKASFIQALNRDEVDAMAPLTITSPTEVIPNGIFVDEFEELPPPRTFRAARPVLGDDPYVLFLSRLHPGKGLDLLASAFSIVLRSVPNARLVIVGPDYGARPALERQVQELQIAERVHILGPLYSTDKLAALRDAACFCLPSRHEAFSIAITEALACGLPCVVSAECHYPELADAGAGRIVSLDPPSIADALTEVLANPSLGQEMGRAGWTLVRERFTWPRIAAQSIDAYQHHRSTKAP